MISVEREVGRRLRDKQKASIESDKAALRVVVEAEHVAKKILAERVARNAKGDAAAAIVREHAPFADVRIGPVRVVILLGVGDAVFSNTAVEALKLVSLAATSYQRARIVQAHALGTEPALDVDAIFRTMTTATRAAVRMGVARVEMIEN